MASKYCILVIEDEKSICNFISKALTAHDYKVVCAYTGKDGLSLISSLCPDIILLDLGLPDMDGINIIHSVREWSSNQLIVVSARSKESDKVAALDAGADDYISKPFGISELLARIRTSIRHSNKSNTSSQSADRPYHALDLTINYQNHVVTRGDTVIHLTPIEYKIVTYLAKNSGKVHTYSSIMQHVWGPYIDVNNTKILRVNMANIRHKIELNPAAPQYIFTEIEVGYRFLDDSE
ncbi:MAG: response regulator [Lachnospiraceae bacterium]|nr:response regulator [Lachnospiraceae bacterium]